MDEREFCKRGDCAACGCGCETSEENVQETPVAKRPPIGATPYTIYSVDRINELLGAIGRYMNETPLNREMTQSAHLWAIELGKQIDMVDAMLIYDT